MNFQFVISVIATVFVITSAQDSKDEEGYQLNPKFPEYAKAKVPVVPKVPAVPEYKKPEVQKLEKPEVPKYEKPEVPELAKPAKPAKPEFPKFEKPEFPEFEKPEYPEYERPEFPVYEKPEITKYERPEPPTYEKPEFPNYERPEFPSYEHPEVPEYKEPEVPSYQVPQYHHSYPHQYVYPHQVHHYVGRPDFSAPQPDMMMMMNKDEEDDSKMMMKEDKMENNDDSAKEEMKENSMMEKKEGEMMMEKKDDSMMKKMGDSMMKKMGDSMMMEKKDDSMMKKMGDSMMMEKKEDSMMKKMGDSMMEKKSDSMMEEKKEMNEEESMMGNMEEVKKEMTMEKKEIYSFPVFNFHEYEIPQVEKYDFNNFEFNYTGSNPYNENATEAQASHQVPEARSYELFPEDYFSGLFPAPYDPAHPHGQVEYNTAPAPEYPHRVPKVYPAQVPNPEYQHHNVEYQPAHPHPPSRRSHEHSNVVEGEGSYYRLDTCEYRFILDMVQCHQEEKYSEKVNVHSTGSGSGHDGYYQGQGPYNYLPQGHHNGYPYPYDSRFVDFTRLYGNPMYYVDHAHGQSYKPGHFDDGLFSYSPSVGHPFYAPGLHNTPFAKYYAGFKAGRFEQGQQEETRHYHKAGYYQSAVQDFHNLMLRNIIKLDRESESSVKTSSQVSVADEVGYEGVTPSFGYKVRLLPNHCSVPGYDGRHTCIVFSGATHPYKMVHRKFVYLKNTREVEGKYRFRYEDGQQVRYH